MGILSTLGRAPLALQDAVSAHLPLFALNVLRAMEFYPINAISPAPLLIISFFPLARAARLDANTAIP